MTTSTGNGVQLTARMLAPQLQGSYEDRMNETKTILVTMLPGTRPTVVFTGWWNGRLVRAAQDSMSRAYRLRRYKPTRAEKPEGR